MADAASRMLKTLTSPDEGLKWTMGTYNYEAIFMPPGNREVLRALMPAAEDGGAPETEHCFAIDKNHAKRGLMRAICGPGTLVIGEPIASGGLRQRSLYLLLDQALTHLGLLVSR